jgi:hypothetical protein
MRSKTKKEFSMKKKIKLLGIIALVMVIAFSFVSCGDLLGGDDNTKGGGGGGDGGDSNGTGWPPNSVLSKVDLGGMTQPTGATDIVWSNNSQSQGGVTVEALVIYFKVTEASKTFISSWFSSNGWSNYTSNGNTYYYKNGSSFANSINRCSFGPVRQEMWGMQAGKTTGK